MHNLGKDLNILGKNHRARLRTESAKIENSAKLCK